MKKILILLLLVTVVSTSFFSAMNSYSHKPMLNMMLRSEKDTML